MIRKLVFVISLLVAGLMTFGVALGQENDPEYPTDNDVNAIAKQLYCPVCPNTPLDVCETQSCQDWREQIKNQLAAGWSDEQVIDYFVTQYGERVLAEPERKGFTSLVWLLPVIAVILGLVILWQVLKSWRNQLPSPMVIETPEHKISQEILSQIEQELQEID